MLHLSVSWLYRKIRSAVSEVNHRCICIVEHEVTQRFRHRTPGDSRP
jgi:hypothetical protein